MATRTLSTSVPLMAVAYSPSPNVLLPADLAAIANQIKLDPNVENSQNASRRVIGGAFNFNGLLFLPWNRGVIRVLPGDVVAVDVVSNNVGWPIVVSADAIANGSWSLV